MKKLPRVLSVAKDVPGLAKDITQVQSGAFPVIEAAFKQVVNADTFVTALPSGTVAGYLKVTTDFGVFYLTGFAAPTF